MKKLLLSILAASVSLASASTVILSSQATGPSVYGSDTTLVPNGGLIRIGYLGTAGDISSFVEFGTSTIKSAGVLTSARPSKVTGSVTNATEADDAGFNNRDVYVWVYSAATQAASTMSGLFRAVGFTFPVDDPAGIGDSVTVTAVSLTEYVTNPAFNAPGMAQGSFNAQLPANADGTGTGRIVLGGPVIPEPSSIGLLALAGLAIARRRR